jgi:hypothetical protein
VVSFTPWPLYPRRKSPRYPLDRRLPTQWIPWNSFSGIKQPERESDHSVSSSAELMNTWSYASIILFVFMVRIKEAQVVLYFSKKPWNIDVYNMSITSIKYVKYISTQFQRNVDV